MTPAEMDTYTFTASAGDKVLVRISESSGNLWPGIRVYSPDGTKLCEASGFGYGTAEIATCSLPSTGTYSILVDGYNGTNTGDYYLYLQRLNNPGSPTPVVSGSTIAGSISPAPEADVYSFEGNAGDMLLVLMTATSGNLSPEVRIYRSDGSLLCSKSTFSSVLNIQCFIDSAGTYYIFVFGGAGTGNYNLGIEFGKWYLGRHSAAPIAFASEGTLQIKISNDFTRIEKIRGDPACLPHEAHAFAYDPGLTLPIANGQFLALGIPLDIPASPGHAHSMDIDGIFFDTNGDGKPDQAHGGFTFRSGSDVCVMLWDATGIGPDTDSDGWSDSAETALGSSTSNATRTPESLTVPTTVLAGPNICEDFKDNDGDSLTDAADPGCPPLPGEALRTRVIAPERVSPGQPLTYIVEYRNDGSETANNVVVSLALDGFLIFNFASSDGLYIPGTNSIVWTLPQVASRASGSFSVNTTMAAGLPAGLEIDVETAITSFGTTSLSGNGQNMLTGSDCAPINSNGINYSTKNKENNGVYNGKAETLGGSFVPWSPDLGMIDEIASVDLGSRGKLFNPDEVNELSKARGCHSTAIGYSGSTAILAKLAQMGLMNGDTLVLVSPVLTNHQQFLDIVNGHVPGQKGFEKMVVLYGEDLVPDPWRAKFDLSTRTWQFWVKPNNQEWEITSPSNAILFWPLFLALKPAVDINMASFMQHLDQIADLYEQQTGERPVTLEVDSNQPGNQVNIKYQSGKTESFPVQMIPGPDSSDPRIVYINIPKIPGCESLSKGVKAHWNMMVLELEFEKALHRPPSNDQIDLNYLGTLCQELSKKGWQSGSVVATARDPNAKSVTPEFAQPGDTLNFTVEFENEGEGTAYGVYVIDTLDPDLDDSTLTFPATLPPLVDSYTYNPDNRTIVWYIGEVGPGEGGQLPYSIAVRNDAPPDYLVTNYATVYFTSVPEVTNTNGVAVTANYSQIENIYLPLVLR